MFAPILRLITANMDHWDFPSGDKITNEIKKNQPKQSRTGFVKVESTKHYVSSL